MKERLGHYEIVSELGRGGMGVVYKGYEPALTRYVAIKQLSPALAHDQSLVERFLREARAMASLNDPNIVQVHFIGQHDQQPFFAMEFVEGESLATLVRRVGRLPVADVLRVLLQTARGLHTAHEHGVIHRDIKPANLLLDARGRVKIADFGIALARQEFDAKLTGTGEFVGTPGYLSPEVCLGKPVDARSDLFALGIVMFESLTGRLPFSDESPLKLMLDVVQAEIPDIQTLNADVDADTARILSTLLAKDPADRYPSAAAVVAELEHHPLLVGRGTQVAVPIAPPSGAAATLYSAPPTTPTARRAPTPPPEVGPLASAPPPSPDLARPADTATRAPAAAARSRSNTPVAVAAGVALLMLATAGYGAWTVFGPQPDAGAAAIAAAGDAAASASEAPVLAGIAGAVGIAGAAASTPAAAAAADVPVALLPMPPADGEAAAAVAAPAARPAAPPAARVSTTVAVVGNGDPAIVIPAVQALEARATAAGWRLTENTGAADRVIRVNFDVTGTQQLQFYGNTSEMLIGQLSVRAFGSDAEALGAGLRQRIEFTALNADAKVEQALAAGDLDGLVGRPGRR